MPLTSRFLRLPRILSNWIKIHLTVYPTMSERSNKRPTARTMFSWRMFWQVRFTTWNESSANEVDDDEHGMCLTVKIWNRNTVCRWVRDLYCQVSPQMLSRLLLSTLNGVFLNFLRWYTVGLVWYLSCSVSNKRGSEAVFKGLLRNPPNIFKFYKWQRSTSPYQKKY